MSRPTVRGARRRLRAADSSVSTSARRRSVKSRMKVDVDPASAVPLYFQVKEAIRTQIADGSLKPGDRLPAEVALGEQLGISRLTIHRALRELVTEGLLVRQRAKGTFVALPRRRAYEVEGPLFSLTEDLSRDGLEISNRILSQDAILPSDDVRWELGLAPGGRAIRLLNLRIVRRQPFALEDIHLPYDRFPELATLDLNDRSLYASLEERYGALPQEAIDRVTAGAATADEARRLGIRPGRPVLRVRRTAFDSHGQPVEYSVVTFHAERYELIARAHRRPRLAS